MAKPKRSRKVDVSLPKDYYGNRVVHRVASQLYASLDTPIALSCFILLKHKEYEQLVAKEIDPLAYNDAFKFRDDYQAVSYLRKYPGFDLGIDRDDVAFKKFLDTEESCLQLNRRLESRRRGEFFFSPRVESVLYGAQRKIAELLGPLRMDCLLDSGFGPGVTSSCGGERTGLAEKFRSELNATRDAVKYIKPLLGLSPLWSKALSNDEPFTADYCDFPVKVIDGSKVAFVPKDAKTSRTICIEPHLNIYFQKGVGTYLKRLLKRRGVDLRKEGQPRNQWLARLASRTGYLATIDLSSASDTVSRELVWDLLPYDWACFLDDLRSKRAKTPSGSLYLQKWSSMGNGYTFELESLLFWAFCRSTAEYLGLDRHLHRVDNKYYSLDELIGVYGDDLIVPVDAFELLSEVLTATGFTLNRKKSFSSGSFRESCGRDWFLGVDVRPVFLRKTMSSIPVLYSVYNSFRRLSHKRLNGLGCDIRLKPVCDLVESLVPRKFRFRIPDGVGDLGLVSNWDEARPTATYSKRNWVPEYKFSCLIPKGVKYVVKNSAANVIQSLLGLPASKETTEPDDFRILPDMLSKGEVVPSMGRSTLRRQVVNEQGYVSATEWRDLGAWI